MSIGSITTLQKGITTVNPSFMNRSVLLYVVEGRDSIDDEYSLIVEHLILNRLCSHAISYI